MTQERTQGTGAVRRTRKRTGTTARATASGRGKTATRKSAAGVKAKTKRPARTTRNTTKATGAVARKRPKKAAHDAGTPAGLHHFMLQGWKAAAARMPARLREASLFAARRRALSAAFPGEFLIIPTGHERVRVNDTHFGFRPGTEFAYLTGNHEPDCVLVLVPKAKSKTGHTHVLYVEPNPGKGDATFFTDRDKGALWVGPRLGVEQSVRRFGVDEGESLADLPQFLAKLKKSRRRFRALRGVSPALDRRMGGVKPTERDQELAAFLSEQRLVKDKVELSHLQTAADITARGFDDIVCALKTARCERQVEAAFVHRARVEGNDVGYGTIVASGAHACILHWTRNDGALEKDKLILVDAGAEDHSLYTADVTRTLPMGGKYTATQREVYDLVCEAQAAAFAAIKPGAPFVAPHKAAMEVLARGLVNLGLLKCSLEQALDPDQQLYRRYTLHGVSHMLGMDVHDCAHARPEHYRNGPLREGMVLTVEPGLYFQPDDLTVPARYRGIGVRIEDDVVVTRKGCRLLTQAIPRQADDVEAWMARLWRKKRC